VSGLQARQGQFRAGPTRVGFFLLEFARAFGKGLQGAGEGGKELPIPRQSLPQAQSGSINLLKNNYLQRLRGLNRRLARTLLIVSAP